MNSAPIGVFDSGMGGLTVARAIRAQLPHESILYVGDTAHAPYGPRPIAQIREFSLQIMDELVAQGVKMLVIACNSATAAVLADARERYAVPVIEVIAPAVRSAVRATRTGKIGVIGTEATVNARAYHDAFAAAVDITLVATACPKFVEFVERGDTTSDELVAVAREYLEPMITAGVDTLVLGCTHYPLLQGVISYVMGPDVALVSSDVETAKDVYRVLADREMLNPGDEPSWYHYKATGVGDDNAFLELAHRILGGDVTSVEQYRTGAIDVPAAERP